MSETLWRATLKCHDCGSVLNTAEHVPESEKNKVAIVSAFAAGQCPKGCRSTFKDLNINTDLIWEREDL